MNRKLLHYAKPKVVWSSALLLVLSLLLAPQLTFAPKSAAATTSASDTFNRANGALGANWTNTSDGGLTISGNAVIGKAGLVTGDMWAASTFTSDQYSAVQVTATQLSGGMWVGPAVRMQASGQTGYVGIYYWNNGSPVLELFKRVSGTWGQIGSTYNSGALTAGASLQLTAVGSKISLLLNGTSVISVTDTSVASGGAPGIMAFSNAVTDNWSGGSVGSYTIGGTVSGLSGTVVLQDNGADNLSVSASGAFTFATPVSAGGSYNVTVLTNPAGQSCTVTSGSGTVSAANITNVAVSCTAVASYTIGGTVSGLSGTVVLQDNGADNLSVSANGAFTFATKVAAAGSYAVTVLTNPAGQSCTVTSGSGTVAAANVTSVAVSCSASQGGSSASDNFNRANGPLGPNWTDVSDGGLAISSAAVTGKAGLISGDMWTASTFGSNQYSQVQTTSTQLSGGMWIGPGVRLQASGQTGYAGIYFWNNGSPVLELFKRVSGTWGQIGSTYSSGALSAGATLRLTAVGSKISLLLNGGQVISVTDTSVASGGSPGIVSFSNAMAGNWSGGNVTSYTIGGTVSGLSGTVVLQDNGGDNLSVSASGSFTFATALTTGATYAATVLTNPAGQSCTVTSGSGTVGSANVTNVAVACSAVATHSIGGTVSGLSGTVVLQDNGGDNLSISASGPFTFATKVAAGGAYNVTVLTNPAGQSCTVTSGSGTVGSANVTNVTVSCSNTSQGGSTASDNFNRVNGPLGPNWTATSDGGLAISNDAVAGTAGQVTGDMWTASTFGSNQFSAVQVTSTQLSGGMWVGPGVRLQASGQTGYVGIYYWNNGSPQLELFRRVSGGWGQIGSTYNSGALPAGATLQLTAVGSTISLLLNGTQVISVTDTSIASGGAPGIMAFSNAMAGNWSGGSVGSYTVGGTVSGLSGTVVLQDNGADNLSVGASGSFTFATRLASGTAYAVIVKTNPPGQMCTVTSGTGTVGSANVTNVAVSCVNATSYTIGGTVSGLSGTVVVLQDNGGDNLSVGASGPFTFATGLVSGSSYNVTVQANPTGQSCTVTSGSGTVGSANVTNVAVSCSTNQGGTSASDNFNRANGPLGPNWTATSDGGLAIANNAVTGQSGQITGDMWTASTFSSDQFSQVQTTSTQLSGGQWIGPAVRMQSSGTQAYVAVYYWNNGSPELILYLRNAGNWATLGSYNSGALAAGTTLKLVAVGNTVALMENGTQVIGVSDNTLSGGAPGTMAFDIATAGNWSGGNAGFGVSNAGTSSGIQSYNVISANDGYGPQTIRVVKPASPKAGVVHNFLIVLPVEAGLGSQFGDGLAYLQSLDAQDKYNLTMIEPTFAIDPWYANNPNDPNLQYETFLTQELVPWIKANLATTGNEQVWLIGFSKSGIGGQDLILKHPGVFTLAATWDAPFGMSSYDQFGSDSADNYGTNANFTANYELTQAFVDAHKAPFLTSNRIWIGGFGLYQGDDADYDQLLTTEAMKHTTETPTPMTHDWTSGWVPGALAALYQDSLNQ